MWDAKAIERDIPPLLRLVENTFNDVPLLPEPPAALPTESDGQSIVTDYAATGLTLRAHPLSVLRPMLTSLGYHDTRRLNSARSGTSIRLPGLVLMRQWPGTAKGMPLAAKARDPETSRNLVFMALECGDAFPDAVEAIRDVVVPYEVVTIAGWLQGQPTHKDATSGHPRAFLRLLNAVLSADTAAIPPDLSTVLDGCLAADPSVGSDPAFARLEAFRRRSAT